MKSKSKQQSVNCEYEYETKWTIESSKLYNNKQQTRQDGEREKYFREFTPNVLNVSCLNISYFVIDLSYALQISNSETKKKIVVKLASLKKPTHFE